MAITRKEKTKMRIIRENKTKPITFDTADLGDVVFYSEELYIKIPRVTLGNSDVNVVNLETGELEYIPANMLILIVENHEFKYSL